MKISKAQAKKLGIVTPPAKKAKTPTGDKAWFLAMCEAHGLPEPIPEYKFHKKRKWRFDWAWAWEMLPLGVGRCPGIALEIEGGAFRGPGHRSVGVFLANLEKYNEAAIMRWCVIRVTTDQVNNGSAFALVRRALYGDHAVVRV